MDNLKNISKLYNPYDFANPVTNPDLFSGREKTLNEIKYYLQQARIAPRPINIALLGSRAAGKTSLLNMIEIEAQSYGMCTVRINLNEGDTNSELSFFYKIFDAILSSICEFEKIDSDNNKSNPFNGKLGKTYQTYLDMVSAFEVPEDKTWCPFIFPIQYAKAMSSNATQGKISDQNFAADLVKIKSEINTPIILLFDECNVLADHRTLLQMVRNIFMNIAGYMLVFTGTQDLFPVMDEVFSPIVRQFKKIEVGSYETTIETRECIEKPLRSIGILDLKNIFDETALNELSQIHDLTGGRPYEIQLLCHLMFKRVQLGRTKRMELDLDILDDVLNELKRGQDISVRPLITKIKELEQNEMNAFKLLTSCNGQATLDQLWFIEYTLNGDTNLSRESLEQYLNNFVNVGILKNHQGIIQFAGDDFDRIYTKYYARQRKVALAVNDRLPEYFFNSTLTTLIQKNSNLKPINPLLPLIIPMNIHINFKLYGLAFSTELIDVISLIDKLFDDVKSSEVCRSYPELVEAIYWIIWQSEYITHVKPTFLNIYVDMQWIKLNFAFYHCSIEAIEHSELLQEIELISQRASQLGGKVELSQNNIALHSFKELTQQINKSNNVELIHSIVNIHNNVLYTQYMDKNNPENALIHANLLLNFSNELTHADLNNIGYVNLALDNKEEAALIFLKAIEKSNGTPHSALPLYNLGIVMLKKELTQMALDYFNTAFSIMSETLNDEFKKVTIFTPHVEGNKISFTEESQINLYDATHAAISVINSLSDH